MVDGAHPRPVTAPTSVSEAPAASRLVNAAPPTNSSKGAFFAGCTGALSGALIVAIVFFSVYASVGKGRSKNTSDKETHSFCCPDDVEEMARYLNMSVNPCNHFFAYVCSSSIELSRSKNTILDFGLKTAMITGVMPPNVKMAKAGRFLNSFYQTCVTISHRKTFATSLASALLQEEGELLNQVDSRMAMVFIMTASFRYSIRSVLTVAYQRNRRALLGIKAICDPDARSLDCLNATVDALKRSTNSTATTTGTAKLAALLCEQFQGGHGQEVVYNISSSSRNFSREVWNIHDVEAAMDAQGFTLDAKLIKVKGVKEIRLLYDIFTNYTSGDTKAAYLLWHAVVGGTEKLNITGDQFSPQVSEACTDNALRLSELWELFKAEILTTPDKDVEVRNIFAQIKDTAHEQFRRISLIAAEDAHKRDQFFENVRLVTPMEESRASVPVPKATQDFAQNFLKGHRFDHEVSLARRSQFPIRTQPRIYRGLLFLEDRYILLSPKMYDFIRTGPSSRLPNMAILGQRLAESLWSMVLHIVKWENKTTSNIRNFSACFYDTYTNNAKISRRYQLLYTAVGMSTVRIALKLTDWHMVQQAWSLWMLSHAQFFYILNSYHRCPNKKSLLSYLEISVPIMYVKDFAKAFSCPRNASMTKPRECLDLDQRRT